MAGVLRGVLGPCQVLNGRSAAGSSGALSRYCRNTAMSEYLSLEPLRDVSNWEVGQGGWATWVHSEVIIDGDLEIATNSRSMIRFSNISGREVAGLSGPRLVRGASPCVVAGTLLLKAETVVASRSECKVAVMVASPRDCVFVTNVIIFS